MAIIAGRDAKLQIGVESVWGTAVAPTAEVAFNSESLKSELTYLSEDTLVGSKTKGQMDIGAVKVSGGFEFIAKPDDYFGILLSAALGTEAAPAQVGTTTAYDHEFTPLAGGTSSSLPHLTIAVDRKTDVFGFTSCKVNSLDLKASKGDYLRGSVSVIGYKEEDDEVAALTSPATAAFKFSHGSITIDSTPYDEIEGISFSYSNNLESDLQTLGTGAYQAEIEPQAREITMSLDVLDSTDLDTLRASKFLSGSTADVVLTFTSDATIEAGYYYTLTIDMPLCYVTDDSPTVSGPDRLRHSLSLTATEDDSNEAVTITLRDDNSSAYIS